MGLSSLFHYFHEAVFVAVLLVIFFPYRKKISSPCQVLMGYLIAKLIVDVSVCVYFA